MIYRDEIMKELRGVLEEPDRRLEHIKTFQRLIWEHEDLGLDPEEDEILRDLALDLDDYRSRGELDDPVYYGDERLERDVQSVILRMQTEGKG